MNILGAAARRIFGTTNDRLIKDLGKTVERINALPLDRTFAELNGALREAKGALAAVRAVAEDGSMQELPADVERVLETLERIAADDQASKETRRVAKIILGNLKQ